MNECTSCNGRNVNQRASGREEKVNPMSTWKTRENPITRIRKLTNFFFSSSRERSGIYSFTYFFFLSFFLPLMCSSFVTVAQSSNSGQRSESIFDFCFLDCLGCELRCSWSPKNRQCVNWLFEYRLFFFKRRLNARPSGFVTIGWGQEIFWSHICIVDIELKMYIVS